MIKKLSEFLALALALVLLSGQAWASIPIGPSQYCSNTGGGPVCGTTYPEWCSALQSYFQATYTGRTWTSSVSGSYCTLFWNGNQDSIRQPDMQTSGSCPANSSNSGGVCVCNSPYVESGGACVSSDEKRCADKAQAYDLFEGGALRMPGTSYCPASGSAVGCAAVVNGSFGVSKNGVKTWTAEVRYSGKTCTPKTGTDGNNSNESPTTCKGQKGTVNGVEVCIPFSKDSSPSDSVDSHSTKNPDGSTSTSTSSTSCVGSKCTTTTTTTTTPAGGGPSTTTTTTEEQPRDDFCTKNPRSAMCLESSFSGSCSAPPSCSGDAIQCAMVTEQYKRNCQLYDPDTDPVSAVNKALAGDDPGNVDKMKAAAHNSPITLQGFDFSGRGWSRACPDDPSFSLSWAHGSATEWKLPFSKLCTPLGLAADVAVAITALGCAVFVLRGGGE